ncbi:hypothetical protein G7043_29830 [Lentzea sp. NEAU-D13]|uniref:ATP-grasp domain-containing protein n=1 Tax=Lentzea alba TaxID=2714351 RepID=A0A7C9RVH5_9PSEU|nr:hypothetical protein [Lentzea alba]NGY63126.1 hypothetical protein [Lentzea alba]
MTDDRGTEIVMYWIRSERDSRNPNPIFGPMLEQYAAAFASVNVELRWISVDDLVIGSTGGKPSVHVFGERVDPHKAFFHTMLMSSPHNRIDAWRHLTTYAALEAAGFFVTVPFMHSVMNDDKMLTNLQVFRGAGRAVPTVRINTRGWGTNGVRVDEDVLPAAGISFPAVVKPVDWDGGHSVFLAESQEKLDALLSIAGSADLTMVVQPYLGSDTVDCRVFCVDGEPFVMNIRRPVDGNIAGNVAQGGAWGLVPVPDELAAAARKVAAVFALPYLSVDFLVAGDEWWLSEAELDAGSPDVPMAAIRFDSYRKRFADFVRTGADQRTWQFIGGAQ